MIRFVTTVLAALAVSVAASSAQSTRSQDNAAQLAGARADLQNDAIDQGMAEAADKAERAMEGATIEMSVGILSGAANSAEQIPQPPRPETDIAVLPPGEGPNRASRATEAPDVGQRDTQERSPCDPNASEDEEQARRNEILCGIERMREMLSGMGPRL